MLEIRTTFGALAALTAAGSVHTWGVEYMGGDSEQVKEALASDVQHIHSSRKGFCAVKADGAVVTWGTRNTIKIGFAAGVQHI